ncbi:hypothetical protein PF010_g4056 [Phytophthora fragariae]|uniref:Uncharacterized protein n=1 Tax=Phytophthora fragariae TaxID=53985 RepID=A0A6G0LTA6_9STRA|nr:hypothetical protein PF010_g4056 [Phytophthora fragariae]
MATQLPRRRVIDILEEEVVRCNAELARVDPNGGDVGICNSRIVTLAGIARAWYASEDDVRYQADWLLRGCAVAATSRKKKSSEFTFPRTPAKISHLAVRPQFAVEGKGRKPKAEEIAESRDVASAAIDAFTSALKYNDADLREERSSLNDELEGLKAQLEAKSEECNVLEKEAALHSCATSRDRRTHYRCFPVTSKLMQTLHEDAVPSDPAMPARTAPDTVPTAAASPSSDAAVSAVATAPTARCSCIRSTDK